MRECEDWTEAINLIAAFHLPVPRPNFLTSFPSPVFNFSSLSSTPVTSFFQPFPPFSRLFSTFQLSSTVLSYTPVMARFRLFFATVPPLPFFNSLLLFILSSRPVTSRSAACYSSRLIAPTFYLCSSFPPLFHFFTFLTLFHFLPRL